MTNFELKESKKHEVLIVDDAPASLQLLKDILAGHGYRVRPASSGKLALRSVAARLPDLILLDVSMPEMDGYEVCRRLKSDERSRRVPVIFISAHGDATKKVEGFEAGGVDFISKPFETEEVLARVNTHIRLQELTDRLEQQVHERTLELISANRQLREEIVERERTGELLRKANRAYKVLSDSNQAMVYATDESALLQQVCRIIEEECGYHLVWIGLAEHDPEKTVRPVAQSGFEEGYLDTVKITWADTQRGRGPTGVAIRTAKPVVNLDILSNPDFAPWRAEAIRRGYASSVALPLLAAQESVLGALNVYANRPNAFSAEETELLMELARNLAYGIMSLRAQADQRLAEKRSMDMLQFLQILMETIPVAIFFKDSEGIYRGCNKAYEAFLGLPKERIIGKSVHELFPKDLADKYYEMDSALFRQPGKQVYEWQITFADGNRHDVIFNKATYFNTDGRLGGLVCAMVDITDRKHTEEELKRHRDHLEALVKERTAELVVAKELADAANAAKSDFLARMSHEIRTPINAVIGLTNLVLKSALGAQQRDHLNKVQLSSRNLLALINDILDFSKVEAGRLELESTTFALDDLLDQAINLFSERSGERDLELILSVDRKVPRVLEGDPLRLAQVLTNLVENAVKFTEQGEIMVRVELDEGAGQSPDRVGLRFWVRDTGIGIAPDILPSLFEPFTQAGGYLTRRHQGAGLGLAICRRLVDLMGGSIRAESAPNHGSIFTFTVSLAKREAQGRELKVPYDLHGLKVLVVDDSAWSRQVLVDILESFTFKVSTVDGGEQALGELRRAAGTEPYRLVLLDWKMPGMDGFETAEQIVGDAAIGKAGKPPAIIMVTACGLEVMHRRSASPSIEAYVLKPILPSQLFNTIMALFGKDEALVVRPAPGRKALPSNQLATLRGRRVLVVEDNALNRDVVVALLEEVGLVVVTAETGKQAVDKVTGAGQGYDAVLMDIQMPIMDGYEATRQIRQREHPQPETINKPGTRLPIIALTAHALKGEKEKCLAAGMDDYLAKPIDEQELYRLLLKWILHQQANAQIGNPPQLLGPHAGRVVLDDQAALKRLGDRKQIYLKALRSFAPGCGQAHEVIARHLDADEVQAAARTAHTVKGVAATIGAMGLSQVAAELDKAIAAGQKAHIVELLDGFASELKMTLQAVDSYLEANTVGSKH
jgi:two-component system sensor histidine kinase/response regulator